MKAKKCISKILPEDIAKKVGHVHEVLRLPLEQTDIYIYTQALAQEKGYSHFTEDELDAIIHESRGVN